MTSNPIILILVTHFLATVSPGPDFAIVVRQSLTYSRQEGLLTALGIAVSNCILLLVALLGLQSLLHAFPSSLLVIQLIGGTYLIWLGVSAEKNSPSRVKADSLSPFTLQQRKLQSSFKTGFITSFFNAKCILYFFGILSSVLAMYQNKADQIAVGLLMILISFGWFSFVAIVFSTHFFRRYLSLSRYTIDRILSVVICGLGACILFRAGEALLSMYFYWS